MISRVGAGVNGCDKTSIPTVVMFSQKHRFCTADICCIFFKILLIGGRSFIVIKECNSTLVMLLSPDIEIIVGIARFNLVVILSILLCRSVEVFLDSDTALISPVADAVVSSCDPEQHFIEEHGTKPTMFLVQTFIL